MCSFLIAVIFKACNMYSLIDIFVSQVEFVEAFDKFWLKEAATFALYLNMIGVFIVVEPACGERDIVVTVTVWCTCLRPCIRACMCLSEFVRTIISTIKDGFQNNLTILFSIKFRCAI